MRRFHDPATGQADAARHCRAVHAARPVPYHRMATLRDAWSARAKPLLTLLAALIAYVVLASVLLVLVVLLLALAPGVNLALGVTSGDPTSPLDVGLALAMGALWLPAGLIAVRIGGWRPIGTLWSVAARARRRLLSSSVPGMLLAAFGIIILAAVAGAVAAGLASPDAAEAGDAVPAGDRSHWGRRLAVVVVVLILAPLQAVGIELALRGCVLQAVGTWTSLPWVAIAAVALLAVIGRDLHPAVLVPAVVLAICCAALAWKSGGLEVPLLFAGSLSILSLIGAAVLSALPGAAGGAGAGISALVGATAAPGTSNAALAAPVAASGQLQAAALAGGLAGACGIVIATVVIMQVIGTRWSVRLNEPVGREVIAPLPQPVAI